MGYSITGDPALDAAPPARKKPSPALSAKEIVPLVMAARAAYDSKARALSFDAWRRYICERETDGACTGLSNATRDQFDALAAAFAAEGGEIRRKAPRPAAPAAWLLNKLQGEMQTAGIEWSYLAFIHRGVAADALDAKTLWRCIYTIRNRANARDGKGSAANRNKSQRGGAE
jgi:hypothetical protein